ncbi:MAG: hypothetical protein ONB30_00195 [candidate division KSB1 bacterium]|nr:hypothetical protein [candidate division KSB1 bacterium]
MSSIQEVVSQIKQKPIEGSAHLYHPIPFPEFDHLTSSSGRRNAIRRWKLIHRALPTERMTGKRILDIGANAGFFSYEFAKLGAVVDAIEPHKPYYDLGVAVVAHYGVSVSWFAEPLSAQFLKEKQYEIALMLSVFQWISEGNAKLQQACELLRLVSEHSNYLFFEMGCNHGSSAITARGLPVLVTLKWVYQLLRRETIYQNAYLLGFSWPHVSIWRPWGYLFPRAIFVATSQPVALTCTQRLASQALARWLAK